MSLFTHLFQSPDPNVGTTDFTLRPLLRRSSSVPVKVLKGLWVRLVGRNVTCKGGSPDKGREL